MPEKLPPIKGTVTHRFCCPCCGMRVRNPDTYEMEIPVAYIGPDPVGFKCTCGRVISMFYDMIKVEFEGIEK